MGQYNIKIRQGDINNQVDRELILSFFDKLVPEYNRDTNWLEWTYNSNDIITLALDKNQVIGFYGIIRSTLKVGDKILSIGKGINALIDPNYSKKISILEITDLSYKIAKEANIDLLIGFPNQNYHLIQEKIEKWSVVSRFKALKFINPNISLPKYYNAIEVNEEQLTLLLKQNFISLSYIEQEINWIKRYYKAPKSPFKIYALYKKELFVGLVVIKIYQENIGHIIDFKLTPYLTYDKLLECGLSLLKSKYITLFPTNISFLTKIIQYCPQEDFTTNFLIKFLNSNLDKRDKYDILNINNWNLNMGISDAF